MNKKKQVVNYLDYEVIIIEDNLLVNNFIQNIFRLEGIKYRAAKTATEAFNLIKGTKKEILLLDYKLPDLTGDKLIEELRKKYKYNPCFIIMTGFGDEKIAVNMMKLGAKDYIIKTKGFTDILPEIIKRVIKDLDKEKDLEETQKSFYKNYQLLNETGRIARIGGWEVNLSSNEILFTQSVSNIIKLSSNDSLNVDELFQTVSPEYQSKFKNAYNDAIKKGTSFNLEFQLKNGKENNYWVHMIGKPEMQKGKCVRLNGTIQDITDRKKSEELIITIDKKNKFLLKIAEDLLAINNLQELYDYVSKKIYELIDQNGVIRIIEFNDSQTKWEVKKVTGLGSLTKKIQKIAGFNIEDIKGTVDKNFITDLVSRKLTKTTFNFNELTAGKVTQNQGEAIKKILGLKSLFSIPFNQNNKIKGIINIASFKDNYPANTELIEALITEVSLSFDKLTAQEALNKNLKEKELITKNIPNIIWKITFSKNGNVKSTYISEVVDEFLALPPGTIRNNWKKALKYFKPEYIEPFKAKFISSLKSQKTTFSFEFEANKANGKSGWFMAAGKSYKEEDEISFYGYVTEITKIKSNEIDLIEAKNKAEESDRLKSAFLANISHEIRTPMNSIMGAVNILKEKNMPGNINLLDETEELEFYDIITKSGYRMLETVKNIIDISRIQTEQVEIRNTEINICEEFKSICKNHYHEIQAKGLKLIQSNHLSVDELIICSDREKLNTIFNNLISNAIKFTYQGFIETGCKKQDNSIIFYVKDSGIGISKEKLEAIFKPFEQADLNLTRGHEGSGLGLSIAKSYIKMLKGDIWVESEKGMGSVFYFTLPLIKPENKKNNTIAQFSFKKGSNSHPINGKGNLKILLVEDDEISHKLMLIQLKKITNNVISAFSGKEAVDICRKNTDIDLVLMDIKMPEMDGFKATKKIREFNTSLPIIAQTAFALVGDKERAFDTGFNDYLTKPIDKIKLMQVIEKYSKTKIMGTAKI